MWLVLTELLDHSSCVAEEAFPLLQGLNMSVLLGDEVIQVSGC